MSSKKNKKYLKQKLIRENIKAKNDIQELSDEDIEIIEEAASQPTFQVGDFVLIEPSSEHHNPKYLKAGPLAAQIVYIDFNNWPSVNLPRNYGKYGWYNRVGDPVFNTNLPIPKTCRTTLIAPIDLTPDGKTDNLHRFLRGLLSYDKLVQGAQPHYNFVVSNPITLTPEDLLTALRHLQSTQSIDSIYKNYILPIYNYLYKFVGCNFSPNHLARRNYSNEVLIPHDATLVIKDCFMRLMFSLIHNLVPIDNCINDCIDVLETYFHNVGKRLCQLELPKCNYNDFIAVNVTKAVTGKLDRRLLPIFKTALDQQEKRNNLRALEIKAWSYYGGNSLYDCDWNKSAEYLHRLSKDHNKTAADCALGYIYYYGRLDGQPDYNKALVHFTTASLNGDVEATYKLLDMMYNNYVLPKNEDVIYNQLVDLYETALSDIVQGDYSSSFADIAWRYARCYKEGLSVKIDYALAYRYYMQSFVALIARRPDKHYGDAGVLKRVKENIIELLEARYANNSDILFNPWMDIWKNADNDIESSLKEFSICDEVKTLISPFCAPPDSVCLPPKTTDQDSDSEDEAWYEDDDEDEDAWEDDGAWKDEYEDEDESDVKDSETTVIPSNGILHFASVEFWPNGKTYDYICEDMTIKPGDSVKVITFQGEKIVTVKSISDKHIQDLPLPFNKYKKIEGRA